MKKKIKHNSNASRISLRNSVFWNKVYIIILIVSANFSLNGQIIFQETFSGPDGTTTGTANGINWSTTCPTCIDANDYFDIKSGVLEARDTNGEAIWITDTPIDVSNCGNIEISFDIESLGTMEACGTGCTSVDFVSFQYNIDGAGWINPSNSSYCAGDCASINVIASDDTPFFTYSSGCIPTNGNNLQLKISAQCWASAEYWRIDNITVSCSGQNAGTDGNLSICSTSSISNLFDQLGGNPVNGGTWTGPSNLTGGDLGTFDPVTMNPGVYSYTVGAAPCQVSSNVTVSVASNSSAGTDNSADLCSDAAPINLYDLLGGNPDNNGVWTGPSNLTGGDLGTFDPATMSGGTYTYTIGNTPCQVSAVVTVNIIPSGNAGNNNTIDLCSNSPSLNLFEELGGTPDNNGTWIGPSNLTGGDLGTFDPATMNGGTYTYTIGNTPCAKSASVIVSIGGPTAAFTANPTTTTIENTIVVFTNGSQNATDYIWDFDDNSVNSTDINPTHIFPDFEPGVYTVTLTAFDASNCSDSQMVTIVIIAPEMKYEIPNVFTPNEDGENDFFKLIHFQNINTLDIVIVNRWGNIVFESNKVDFKWNGKVKNNGTECVDGTYFYKINLTDLNGKETKEHGFTQLSN